MAYYIKRTTKMFCSNPITVVVNDYSTRELAERALKVFQSMNSLSGVEFQKFFIDTNAETA